MKRWRNSLRNRNQQIGARRSVSSWIHIPSFTHNRPDKITACFTASIILPPLDALGWVKLWTIRSYLASKTIRHCSYHLKCFTGQRFLLVCLPSISTPSTTRVRGRRSRRNCTKLFQFWFRFVRENVEQDAQVVISNSRWLFVSCILIHFGSNIRVNSSQRRRRSYVEIQEEEVLELRLQRRKWNPEQGLGLTVAGGGGSFPYRGTDEGMFVAKIIPGGVADLAGLKLDDEILSINGIYCYDLEHAQAVNLLRNTRGDLIVRVRRQIPRLVESAIPSMDPRSRSQLAPLIRSRSSYQLSPSKREDKQRSRTPDPQRRRRSSTQNSRVEDTYPATPVEESGYLRPRTPPLRRMSYQVEPTVMAAVPYPSSALQHTHLDSSGIHFHPYCFACNPSVIHLNPSAQLQLPPISPQLPRQHIYSTPASPSYPSPAVELNSSFNSRRGSTKWTDYEEEEEDDSDTNRFTVRLQRDDVTGLGFIVSSMDGKPNSSGVRLCVKLWTSIDF